MRRLGRFGIGLLFTLAACGDSASPPTGVGSPPFRPAPPPSGPEVGPLVAGTLAYVAGALVWTDYAYDDRGPNQDAANGGDRTRSEFAGGDAVYPPGLANGADLIQLQLSVYEGALSVWAILETLVDPSVPVLAVAFDTDRNPMTGASSLPGNRWTVAGSLGVEVLLRVSEQGGQVWTYADGSWSATSPFDALVDPETNGLGTTVPPDRLAPEPDSVWRVAAALGIATADGDFLDGAADIFDLAFVGNERFVRWQDNDQADVLAGALDAATAVAEIDFRRLREGSTATVAQADDLTPGFHTFLYRSDLRLAEGVEVDAAGTPIFLGPYQPYLVWVPEAVPTPTPLIVFLHGSDQNHLGAVFQGPEQFYIGTGRALSDDPHLIATLGFAGDGFDFPPHELQIWPLARGARLGYRGIAHQDVLDVIADTMGRFDVDPDRVILMGASMGGIGAYRLGTIQPDRWSVAFPLIGYQSPALLPLSVNLRNLPVRQINGGVDPLIDEEPATASAAMLDELGYDYRYWLLLDRGHEAGGYVWDCLYVDARNFVRRTNPANVRYAVDATLDEIDPERGLDLRFDSAYWVSAIRPREPSDLATVDATSLALPRRERSVERVDRMLDNVESGADLCGPNPDVQTGDRWHERAIDVVYGGELPRENRLVAQLDNVSSVRLDLERAGLDRAAEGFVSVTSDGPVAIELIGLTPGQVAAVGGETRDVGEDGRATFSLPAGESIVTLLP